MLRTLFASTIMAVSLATAAPVFADSHSSMMPCHGKERMQKMMQMLNLDAAQQAKIAAIKEKNMSAVKDSWKQLKEIRAQMKSMVTSGKIDEAALDKLIQQKASLMTSWTKAKIMTKNEIYNVLNDQQKMQYQEMMKKWEEKKAMFKKECHG